MKFDMSRAWNEAVAILTNNAGLMMVIAGIFVLLPNVAASMLIPPPPQLPSTATPEQALEVLSGFYSDNAIWMFLLGLFSMVGSLSLYALLSSSRPTVADALKIGLVTLIFYLLAQLIWGVAIGVIGGVVIGIPAAAGIPALAIITGIAFFVFVIYTSVKFSMLAPVMVIEGVRNPIAALKRSWSLTKGNSLRLFGYYLILMICIIVVYLVATVVVSVFVALLGDGTAGLLVSGLLMGIMASAVAVLGVGIIAAVHRQLAGETGDNLTEAFE